MKTVKLNIIILLIVVLSFLTTSTFAFWSSSISDTLINGEGSVEIGN
jgi:hypothetical protein